MDINELHKKICDENKCLGFQVGDGGGNALSSVLLDAMWRAFTLGQKSVIITSSGSGGAGVQMHPHCGADGRIA